MSNTDVSEVVSIVRNVSSKDIGHRRARIEDLERAMLKADQVEIPVTHAFSGGMYSREITIPKGTLLTGRIHKFDHFDVMLSGDITVSTDSGEVKRLTGTNISKGRAGKKRAGYAHEDTRWITFHSAEERNPEDMYEYLTCGSFEDLELYNVALNRISYTTMIESLKMTEEEVQVQVLNEDDRIAMPAEFTDTYYINGSDIQGKGLFAKQSIEEGKLIAPARIEGLRTDAGRYTNHAMYPNAVTYNSEGNSYLMALKDISANEEITVNYRDALTEESERGGLCQ